MSFAGVARKPCLHSTETNVSLGLPDNEDPYADSNSKGISASGASNVCYLRRIASW